MAAIPAVVDHLAVVALQTRIAVVTATTVVAAAMIVTVEIAETVIAWRSSAVAVSFAAKLGTLKIFLLCLMSDGAEISTR